MSSEVQIYTPEKSLKLRGILSVLKEFFGDLADAYFTSGYSVLSAYYEIKSRYETSVLGPLWMVLSNIIFISVISLIYSSAFGIQLSDYVPFLTAGYLLWMLMVNIIQDGSVTFIWYGHLLKNNKISPLVIYSRLFSRAVIIFAHNIPVIFLIVLYYKGFVFNIPELLFGLTLFVTCTFFMGLAISIMACRFRDIAFVLPSIFQVLILMMPILWKPEMITGRKTILLEVNVIYQLLEIVRAPILGVFVPLHYYINCLALLVVSFLLSAYLYVGSKNKLVLWS